MRKQHPCESRRRLPLSAPESLEARSLLVATLVVSEINYDPYEQIADFGDISPTASDYEFLEVMNSGTQTVNLAGMAFVRRTVNGVSEGVDFRFPGGTLAPSERTVVVRSITAFRSQYGDQVRVAGQWSGGGLSNQGELLTLVDAGATTVFQVAYGSNSDWPSRANGVGASLELKELASDPNDPNNWRSSAEYGGSPGAASAERPARVLINEILAHTDPPLEDAVELRNLTGSPVDVSGWYFSDRLGNPFNFSIRRNTIIPAGGYLVLTENDFNPGGGTLPGDFALSESGDRLVLVSAKPDRKPLYIEDYVILGPTANGVSVGNVLNQRDTVELLPLEVLSVGRTNGGHMVSDIVISEVQYHPAGNSSSLEFIELRNATDREINAGQWQIDDAVKFSLPLDTVLKPREAIVIVPFSSLNSPLVDTFRDYYEIDDRVRLFGPWSTNSQGIPQSLSNSGENVTLRMPMDDVDLIVYAAVDRVEYRDKEPWPLVADGLGGSLSRTLNGAYGNQVTSWEGTRPSPGDQPPLLSQSLQLVVDLPLLGNLGSDGDFARGAADVDVYLFQPTETASFDIRVNGIGLTAADTVLRVFSLDGIELAFNDDTSEFTNSAVKLKLDAGASYYVVVSGKSETPQSYDPFTGEGLVIGSMGDYEISAKVGGNVPNPHPWHNRNLPEDVTGDGAVVPFDALLVINQLNEQGVLPESPSSPPPYFDVKPDNVLSPIDALLVINYLNSDPPKASIGKVDALPIGINEQDELELLPAEEPVVATAGSIQEFDWTLVAMALSKGGLSVDVMWEDDNE